jgi:agarase-like CBM domain-containing protein/glycosyl hydrolase family 42 (putative beta-galactosidase)
MRGIMIRVMQGRRPVLILCLFFALSLIGMGTGCNNDPPPRAQVAVVTSFESQNDLGQLKATDCKTALTTEHVTNGQHALEVQFSNPERAAVELSAPAGNWDWRKYGAVAVDVVNPSDEEIQVAMQLGSAEPGAGARHWSADYSGNVGPHATVSYYYAFGPSSPIAHGMRGGPPTVAGILPFSMIPGANEAVSAEGVARLKLSFQHGAATQSVVVDNIRLLPPFNYDGIVDSFGQYTRADWPDKVKSQQDLAAQKQQEAAEVKAHPTLPDRDAYGGWASGPHVPSTGYFSTVKRDGKWWLVDPDGHLFFSTGIDVIDVHPNGDAYTFVTGRKEMFTWMPGSGDPLSKFYSNASSVVYGPTKEGQTFGFYTANLERKYGANWQTEWQTTSLERLRAWGFNTIGNWSDPALYAYKKIPYVATISIHGDFAHVPSGNDYWGPMPDPFDPQYIAAANADVGEVARKHRDDRWCIGYYVDNELSWGGGDTDRTHYGLAYGVLSANGTSPAKRAFVKQLQSHYGSVGRLNRAWGAHFASWPALLDQAYHPGDVLNPKMRKDFSGFLTLDANQYFKVIRDAIKKSDPHHLYLGAKFAWRTPEAVQASARYCDVVSFDIYKSHVDPKEWAFTTSLNKPCMDAEFHFGAVDRGMFHTGLVSTPNQQARAAMYKLYLENIEDLPAFVGCQWFEYYDEPLTGRVGDGENYNIGFVSVTDTPYREMVETAKAVSSEVYERRAGKQTR